MTRLEKENAIAELKEKFDNNNFFYLTDSSTLSVADVNDLRRKCFEHGVEMKVVKNTLARNALESAPEEKEYAGLYDSLKGPTALLFTSTANIPAKIIEEFRKSKKTDRPILKAAYIDYAVFVGDDQLKALANIKSKEELIGEIVALLQSPMKNVVGALKSGGNTLAGLVKALEEREQ